MRDREVTRIDLGLLSVLMGVATTVFFYRYGVDNQISELPIVLRAIDPGYLLGDFYTDATAGPGPRFYFARGVALFASRVAEALAFGSQRRAVTKARLALLAFEALDSVGIEERARPWIAVGSPALVNTQAKLIFDVVR